MKKSIVVLLHLGYWMTYFLLIFILFLGLYRNPNPGYHRTTGELLHNIFLSPVSAFLIGSALSGFYIFYGILFPKFLSKKKIIALILVGILVSLGSTLLIEILLSVFVDHNIMFADNWDSAITITIFVTFITLVHGTIGLVIKGFITSYNDITLKEELNKKNYETELALMKAQINPHFLFNTINNIDVLIQKDAAKASEYLNKLSDIMRFMLYETKTEKIELSKELSYIEKYIELQKIRTSNTNYIKYEVQGNANTILIEPMLFIPFIENAFKHSENKKIENAVNISIVIENDKLIFTCENYYSANPQQKLEYSGLGNELIERRLALLYPNKHTYTITNKNEVYTVNLIISF